MTLFTRRDALQIGAGALAGTTMLASGSLRAQIAVKDVAPPKFEIESGATLRVLRPSKFVQGDETLFLENSKKFTEQTGVAGHGHQRELGGPAAQDRDRGRDRQRPRHRLRLVRRPAQVRGAVRRPHRPRRLSRREVWRLVADRREVRQEPDDRQVDRDADRRLRQPRRLPQVLGQRGRLRDRSRPTSTASSTWPRSSRPTAIRSASRSATPTGDANSWCHWLMWTHGGSLTDENDQVTINSKETIEALKYGKELAATFIPGAASWLDPSNNKAFLAGEISATGNGISIYYAAKNSRGRRHQGDGRGHLPRADADRPGRQADRAGADRQPDDLHALQVPERGQGISALHDGGGAVPALADGLDRLLEPPAPGLRQGADLDRRPQAHALPARALRRDLGRLSGAASARPRPR